MKMTTQLSVSSAILAAVLSGCSQQPVVGGSQQVAGGSQQMYGGSQLTGSQQMSGSSQLTGSQQMSVGSQLGGSQQQIKKAEPVVKLRVTVTPPPTPIRVYQPKVIKQRVYTRGPTPRPARSIQRKGLGLPPARPGQCFAKVKVPAKYITKSRRVLIQKASSKRVLKRAPQYRWQNQKVLVRKATHRTRVVPAQYRTTTKRVLVKPSYHTWRKGHGPITRIDNMTGQIMCRVTVPAAYKNVTRRVLVRPAQKTRIFVPAVYKTVKKKKHVSSALYKTVHRPARYKTQNYRVKVGGARYVWRSILCQTNAPKNYRASMLKRKPVARASHQNQYRSSGITQQQYMQVMNAMPVKKKQQRTKRKINKTVTMPKLKTTKSVVTTPKVTTAPNVTKTTKSVVTAPKVTTTPKATDNPSQKTIKKNIVYGIQAALKAKGYNPGKLDGKMGPDTAAALKAFQSSRGLPVGVLSKDTFRALGLVR